ncbi:hypothetical protein Q7P36_000083 [Cladosporium allicinum]
MRQNPLRPSAAVPRESLNRQLDRPATTIRFKEPNFKGPRAGRLSSTVPAAGCMSDSSARPERTDSFVPILSKSSPSTQTRTSTRRKSTAASLFGTRSWSMFWDPRISAIGSDDSPAQSSSEVESGVRHTDGEGKHRSFFSRCKSDRLLHFVIGMVVLVGSALIICGVVWTETHQSRVMEDKRDFVCGHGIAGGPKCRVHLKGEKSGMGSADWVGGEVVDWWLKNHCVWRGNEKEWWCGSEIGLKEGEGDQVLPDGTWLEKVEESDDGEVGVSGPG